MKGRKIAQLGRNSDGIGLCGVDDGPGRPWGRAGHLIRHTYELSVGEQSRSIMPFVNSRAENAAGEPRVRYTQPEGKPRGMTEACPTREDIVGQIKHAM